MSHMKLLMKVMVLAGWHLGCTDQVSFQNGPSSFLYFYFKDDKRWTARHNTVRAHAEAWHIYDKEFRSEQKGLVGITLNTDWVQPITDSDKDHQAAAAKNAFDLGYWADPIYKTGDYPQIVKDLLAKENAKLPSFTPDEIKKNLGKSQATEGKILCKL